MTYAYIRFSTNAQDDVQQRFALDEYAKQRGLSIDEFIMDEGISGGVSYKERKLYGLIKRMKPGDTLITTEISRLGRSMGDLNMLVTQELKPRKLRLIVVKMGLDLDCSNLKAVDEMVIFAFGFAAQCEKDMIVQRTQSALDARKDLIKKDGGFISKRGNYCDHLGRKKGQKNPNAILGMTERRMEIAQTWREQSRLYSWVTIQLLKGVPRRKIVEEARKKYDEDPEQWGTKTGKPLTEALLSIWAAEILKKC